MGVWGLTSLGSGEDTGLRRIFCRCRGVELQVSPLRVRKMRERSGRDDNLVLGIDALKDLARKTCSLAL
jgi:hypothetical protein